MAGYDWSGAGNALGQKIIGALGGYDEGQTRMGKELAQQAALMGTAMEHKAKADDLNQRMQYRTPEFATKIAGALAGLTDQQANQAGDYSRSGSWGKNWEDLPQDQAGPPRATEASVPAWATPEAMQHFNQARAAQYLNLGGTGSSNAEQVAKAYAGLLEQGRIDTALQGGTKGLNAYRAADEGKLYSSAPQGILSQGTGVEAPNPAWVDVQRSAALENRAQAGNASAAAAANRARVGEIQANEALTRSKIGQPQIAVGPDGQVVQVPTAPAKPMPAPALKMQQEQLDELANAENMRGQLGKYAEQIQSGALKLGPMQNLESKVRNFAGASDPNSRNFASFQATLEKLRNDSLRLNKGVQTEGDAQRAWNELVTNINDPKVVTQRLNEIEQINARAAQLRQLNINNIRANYGAGPLDVSGYRSQQNETPATAPAPAQSGSTQPVRPVTGVRFGDVRQPATQSVDKTDALRQARAAIASGAPREAVIRRLKELGINDGAL